MGINRDSRHKRRLTGGRRNTHQKKRKFELGRPAAMTKIGVKRVRQVRCRGGNIKHRALRLHDGNFAWGTEGCTRKVRIMDTVYNASNMELVRTKTLTKNTVVQVDATPFKQWYLKHYGVDLGKKKLHKAEEETEKVSNSVTKKREQRKANQKIDEKVSEQFPQGRLLAVIASRPGQS